MENPTHDTPALIHDAPALEALHDTIEALLTNLNDDALVPDRWASTTASALSEADHDSLVVASKIMHRLSLWARYPNVSPESYVVRADAHSVRA